MTDSTNQAEDRARAHASGMRAQDRAIKAFEKGWGITPETIETCDIRVLDAPSLPGGLKVGFPYRSPEGEEVAVKWRYQDREGQRSFNITKAENFRYWPWRAETLASTIGPVVLTEGETDCMRLTQELGETELCVLAMPGTLGWQGHWAELFEDRPLYVVFDNDAARLGGHGYADEAEKAKVLTAEGQVRSTWAKIRAAVPHARRVLLPEGCKDLCDYFQAGYSGDEFQGLLEAADARHEARQAERRALVEGAVEGGEDQLSDLVPPTGFLRAYLDTFAPTTEASDSYLLGAALSVMGTSLGQLKLNVGAQRLPLNLYTLIIGRTTVARKSTTLATARRVLDGTGLPAIGDGFSPEGLEQFLIQNPSCLINLDEYRRVSDVSSKGYGTDLMTVITSAYGGWLYPRVLSPRRDKNGDPQEMEKPRPVQVNVNLLGASTEDWLDALSGQHIRSGFLARHLLLFDNPAEKKWLAWPEAPKPEALEELRTYVRAFQRDCHGEATFSPEAREHIASWYIAWREHFEKEPNDLLQAWWARYDTLARKLATLIEISQTPQPNPVISLDSTERATRVIDVVLRRIDQKLRQGLFAENDQVAIARICRHLLLNDRADEIELASAAELPINRTAPMLDALVRAGRIERLENGRVAYALPED